MACLKVELSYFILFNFLSSSALNELFSSNSSAKNYFIIFENADSDLGLKVIVLKKFYLRRIFIKLF